MAIKDKEMNLEDSISQVTVKLWTPSSRQSRRGANKITPLIICVIRVLSKFAFKNR